MTKSDLRNIYKKKRRELSSTEIQLLSLKILENLKQMDIWRNSVFHCFLPIESQNEIDTFPIIDYLFEQNKKVVVPKVQGLNLINCEIQKGVNFEIGKFNVSEPKGFQEIENQEIDVVFMPMLISDKIGNRVGYGGGFYDRWLNQFKKQPIKIGLNFFEPIDKIQDANEMDVRLDYSVTPEEIVSFATS